MQSLLDEVQGQQGTSIMEDKSHIELAQNTIFEPMIQGYEPQDALRVKPIFEVEKEEKSLLTSLPDGLRESDKETLEGRIDLYNAACVDVISGYMEAVAASKEARSSSTTESQAKTALKGTDASQLSSQKPKSSSPASLSSSTSSSSTPASNVSGGVAATKANKEATILAIQCVYDGKFCRN